jgi:hypothetical protein
MTGPVDGALTAGFGGGATAGAVSHVLLFDCHAGCGLLTPQTVGN